MPRLGSWLLRKLAPPDDMLALSGDVQEVYEDILTTSGKTKALLWFYAQVFNSVSCFLENIIAGRNAMFHNYIKIAIRSAFKQKGYSLINIIGLAVGLACCILLGSYVHFETSFDNFHEKVDRIYRLNYGGNWGGSDFLSDQSNAVAAPYFKENFPEVEDYVRFSSMGRQPIRYEEKQYYETRIFYADNSAFDIFSFKMITGDPATALTVPYTVVITSEIAEKYFGTDDPLGKILFINRRTPYTVTGVVENIPLNSDFRFNMLCSFNSIYRDLGEDHPFVTQWLSFTMWSYLLLNENADPASVDSKIPAVIKEKAGEFLENAGANIKFFLQPLDEQHLHTITGNVEGSIKAIYYVYIISAVAAFVLILACINFINLSTARSVTRCKEVGMRKVFGAIRTRLITQFLVESVLYCCIGLIAAIMLAWLFMPFFASITQLPLDLSLSDITWLLPYSLLLVVIVGVVSGSYPAFFLSAFKPVEAVKNSTNKRNSRSRLRNSLVVCQFVVSLVLIITTGLLMDQIDYMRNKSTGFDKEQVLVLPVNNSTVRNSLETIKNVLTANPNILSAGAGSDVPGNGAQYNAKFPEGFPANTTKLMDDLNIDSDYMNVLGIDVIMGRGFSSDFQGDIGTACLVNETAVKEYGWENPIGKIIQEPGEVSDELITKTVIGVVKDFHLRRIVSKIEPVQISYEPQHPFNSYHALALKLRPEDINNTVTFIEEKWKKLFPSVQFNYYFLDDDFDNQFRDVERYSDILSYFTSLAIFIACLGFFALAAYTSEQRTKEIGIRKVLGSSVGKVIILLNKDLLKWLAAANIIAWPLTYIIYSNLISVLPYRPEINILTFTSAAGLVVLIAAFTVTYQTIKASLKNPVEALKYE